MANPPITTADRTPDLLVAVVNPDGTIVAGGGGTGTLAAQVQGNAASGATDVGNPVKIGGIFNTTTPTVTSGQRVDLQATARGILRVAPTTQTTGGSGDGISASALTTFQGNGSVDGSNVLPLAIAGWVSNGNTWDRQKKPTLTSRIVSSAASTNATSAKGSTGDLFCITGYNAVATVRYLKLYNKATAPTVGTDTPVKTIALPPSSGFAIDYASSPYYFSTGIAYALTTGALDSDTGAVAAGDILGLNLDYT